MSKQVLHTGKQTGAYNNRTNSEQQERKNNWKAKNMCKSSWQLFSSVL